MGKSSLQNPPPPHSPRLYLNSGRVNLTQNEVFRQYEESSGYFENQIYEVIDDEDNQIFDDEDIADAIVIENKDDEVNKMVDNEDMNMMRGGVRWKNWETCGKLGAWDRIVGGVETEQGRYPWLTSIQLSGGLHFCGGSLIKEQVHFCFNFEKGHLD